MPKKYKGQPTANLGYDPQTTKPSDVRMVIDTASSRLDPETWRIGVNYFVYPGMFTACADTGTIYVYIGAANDPEAIALVDNWIAAGKANDDDLSEYAKLTDLQPFVTKLAMDTYLAPYTLLSVFEEFRQSLPSIYVLKSELPPIDTALSATSHNPVENMAITKAIEENTGDILTVQNTLNALLSQSLGTVDWTILLKEESEMERLTSANTVEGILYFGLEPLDEEDGPAGMVFYENNAVSVDSGVTYADNAVRATGTKYNNNTVTID